MSLGPSVNSEGGFYYVSVNVNFKGKRSHCFHVLLFLLFIFLSSICVRKLSSIGVVRNRVIVFLVRQAYPWKWDKVLSIRTFILIRYFLYFVYCNSRPSIFGNLIDDLCSYKSDDFSLFKHNRQKPIDRLYSRRIMRIITYKKQICFLLKTQHEI